MYSPVAIGLVLTVDTGYQVLVVGLAQQPAGSGCRHQAGIAAVVVGLAGLVVATATLGPVVGAIVVGPVGSVTTTVTLGPVVGQ